MKEVDEIEKAYECQSTDSSDVELLSGLVSKTCKEKHTVSKNKYDVFIDQFKRVVDALIVRHYEMNVSYVESLDNEKTNDFLKVVIPLKVQDRKVLREDHLYHYEIPSAHCKNSLVCKGRSLVSFYSIVQGVIALPERLFFQSIIVFEQKDNR